MTHVSPGTGTPLANGAANGGAPAQPHPAAGSNAARPRLRPALSVNTGEPLKDRVGTSPREIAATDLRIRFEHLRDCVAADLGSNVVSTLAFQVTDAIRVYESACQNNPAPTEERRWVDEVKSGLVALFKEPQRWKSFLYSELVRGHAELGELGLPGMCDSIEEGVGFKSAKALEILGGRLDLAGQNESELADVFESATKFLQSLQACRALGAKTKESVELAAASMQKMLLPLGKFALREWGWDSLKKLFLLSQLLPDRGAEDQVAHALCEAWARDVAQLRRPGFLPADSHLLKMRASRLPTLNAAIRRSAQPRDLEARLKAARDELLSICLPEERESLATRWMQ